MSTKAVTTTIYVVSLCVKTQRYTVILSLCPLPPSPILRSVINVPTLYLTSIPTRPNINSAADTLKLQTPTENMEKCLVFIILISIGL